MNITRKIKISLTEEEAQDFALNELDYQATLTRQITVVDDATTTPETTHFEIEEYPNPVSIEETIANSVDKTLGEAITGIFSPYKTRKQEEAVIEVKANLDNANKQALQAIEARQAEVISITNK